MKKLKIFIAFLVLVGVKSFSQDSLEVLNYYNSHYKVSEEAYLRMGHRYYVHFRDSCLRGTKLAMADFKNGILRTGGFGYPVQKTFEEDRMIRHDVFKKILENEYSITVEHYGCVLGTSKDCYSYFMDTKIKEKYGDSLYQKIWKTVDSLWNNDSIDLPVRFPGGDSAFNKFVYCNLQLATENDSKNTTHNTISLVLDFDKNGKIIKYFTNGIYDPYHNSLNPVSLEHEKEIARLIELMPNWLPQRENQVSIPSSKTIYIYFDERRKEGLNCD